MDLDEGNVFKRLVITLLKNNREIVGHMPNKIAQFSDFSLREETKHCSTCN